MEKSFDSFFEILKNNVKKDEHINWDSNEKVANHVLNYLKESGRNWNDIILLGHLLIELSYAEAMNSLSKKDNNVLLIKSALGEYRKNNKKISNISRDYMLLVSAYHGKPLDNITCNISNSNFISVNLKRRFSVLTKYNFKCAYCGRSPPEVKLQLEHVHPISKGGDSSHGNLVPACFECNSGKSADTIEEIKEKVCNEKSVQTSG